MEIHIQLAGIQLGPYSEKQVRDYIAEGLLSMSDKARIEGTLEWISVSDLITKLPPASEPAPANAENPDAVFAKEESTPLPLTPAQVAASKAPTAALPAAAKPAAAPSEPEAKNPEAAESEASPDTATKRAPEPDSGVTHLPNRAAEPEKAPEPDSSTAATKPLGPISPAASPTSGATLAIRPSKPGPGPGPKTVSTTAPLNQATKKMSRTALAKAFQNRTEPMPSRQTVSASGLTAATKSAFPPVQAPSPAPAGTPPVKPTLPPSPVPGGLPPPDSTGPMAPEGFERPAGNPPAEEKAAAKKGGGIPSLLKALTAKTVPLRGGDAAPSPSDGAASAPPVPGGSAMPVTTPLPTRAIMNPAANRGARRPAQPPGPTASGNGERAATDAAPPEAAPAEKPLEKLPSSRKAAELRARGGATVGLPAEPKTDPDAAAPKKDEKPDADPDPSAPPAKPKPKGRLTVYGLTLLLLVALVGGAYAWLPYHAAGLLTDALHTGNPADLDRLVDFGSVRDSLKQQVQGIASASNTPAATDAVGLVNRSIDLYVTSANFGALVNKSPAFTKDQLDQAIAPQVAFDIITGFLAQPVRSQGFASPTDFVIKTDVADLHLALQGISWKLTRVQIAPGLPGAGGDDKTSPLLLPVVQTYLNRGQEAMSNNDPAAAVSAYSAAIDLDNQSAPAFQARAAAQQAKGDLDGAIKDYTQALTLNPQLADAFYNRANARMAKNDNDGAIADFTDALKINPSMATAYDGRGNAKTAKDDLDGAIQDFTQAISIDPKMANAYSDRGFARQASGNLDGAIQDYTDALNYKPKTPKTYFSRGLARLQQNNLQSAIVDFNEALAFDPKLAVAYFQRGNAESALHDTDDAIADFTQTLNLDSKNALAYCSRGVAREDKGDLDGALADYTKSLELDPKIAVAYFRRALIEVRKGNLDDAIADTTQAIDLDSKNTGAYYYRGFAKLVRGNLEGASADLLLFCQSAPKDRFADNARLYLWLISKLENSRVDGDQALSDALENNWNNSAEDFTAKTAAFLLGRVTESDYLTAASSTDGNIDATQHCQAYYFAGMKRLLMGDRGTAADYFQKCLNTGKSDFCEFILAQGELQSLQAPPPSTTPAPMMAPAPTPPPIAPPVGTTPPVPAPKTP